MSRFEPIFAALDDAGARYVLVGGLAVVLHGYARLTADVDLAVDLSPGQAIKPIAALSRIGLIPRAPVEARDFADPEKRREWIEEKGMRVFSMHDPRRPLVEVDLFVEPPLPFDELLARAEWVTVGARRVPVASIPDLIAMKRIAARPKDEQDIAALEAIARRRTT
ncbi:MAG: nucleotidyltransferase [Sandaracinaceae bacterium]|nr:nucleotidyltransferase [Sandaracinaceae bacterium]